MEDQNGLGHTVLEEQERTRGLSWLFSISPDLLFQCDRPSVTIIVALFYFSLLLGITE